MTDPTDPTNTDDPTGVTPTTSAGAGAGPDDAIGARVRDALGARADGVTPGPADPAVLDAALAADARARLRRNRTLVATGVAAAVLLVVGGVALAGRSSDGDRVTTGSDPHPERVSTTVPGPSDTGDTTTTIGRTTTTVAATSSTAVPTTTTTEAPTTTTTPAPVLPGATTGAKSGSGTGFPPATATAVRIGCNVGFDRIVFEFADGRLPSWSAQYVQPPIVEDPTGDTLELPGPNYLQVRMDGASGHDLETGEPTITTNHVSGGCRAVSAMTRTGDFEGIYSWVSDVNGDLPFVVTTLTNPARLVVDVAHPA